MLKLLVFFKFLVLGNCLSISYGGPFLLWGPEKLNDMKGPVFKQPEENSLRSLFQESKTIVLFIRNGSVPLRKAEFPRVSGLLELNPFAFYGLPKLLVDPTDYDSNLDIIPLSGDPSNQDVEISGLYNDAVTIYGKGNVLAMIANEEEQSHFLYKRHKREAEEDSSSPETGETEKNLIYIADKKAIMYTTSAPVLYLNISGNVEKFELEEHKTGITFDDRTEYGRLSVPFDIKGTVLRIRFNITRIRGYWKIVAANIAYKDLDITLPLSRNSAVPEAPIGFSFRCSSADMCFHGPEGNLTIKDFQVQPWLKGSNRFSDAYDCVGFTTVPIWSGIFVCSILIGILSVGITLLMDIKPPSRFESNRSAQLTFTVQE